MNNEYSWMQSEPPCPGTLYSHSLTEFFERLTHYHPPGTEFTVTLYLTNDSGFTQSMWKRPVDVTEIGALINAVRKTTQFSFVSVRRAHVVVRTTTLAEWVYLMPPRIGTVYALPPTKFAAEIFQRCRRWIQLATGVGSKNVWQTAVQMKISRPGELPVLKDLIGVIRCCCDDGMEVTHVYMTESGWEDTNATVFFSFGARACIALSSFEIRTFDGFDFCSRTGFTGSNSLQRFPVPDAVRSDFSSFISSMNGHRFDLPFRSPLKDRAPDLEKSRREHLSREVAPGWMPIVWQAVTLYGCLGWVSKKADPFSSLFRWK